MAADNGPVLEGGDSMIFSCDDAATTTTPQAEPFLNHDVIGHLCKFLATSDIKNCRLVSSIWNYGATPVLKSRTRTTLAFSPGCDDNGDPFGPDLGGWTISDVVNKLEFCPVNVRLAIPSTKYDLPRPDFAMFLSVNNFKSIVIEYPVGEQFRWQQELFTKFILSASPTLEELESDWLEDEVPLSFPALGGTVFPKLKKLQVDRFFDCDDAGGRIGHAVTTSFPNLKYLEIRCDCLLDTLENAQLPNFQQSLTCLKLGADTDTSGLECLLQIPAGLKKLVFGDSNPVEFEIDPRVDELPTIFYNFLKKPAPTLEELDLDVDWMHGERNLEWKFPVFPVLKKLHFGYSNVLKKIVFETGLESGYFGGINYLISFPVLEVLYIFCNTKESARAESFLPEQMNGQVVPSVKEVDVRVFNYPDVIEQTKIYVRVMALFPNARDQVMSYLQNLLNIA